MRISHTENTVFSAAEMFDIVRDIGFYPEFLPYCTSMQILSCDDSKNRIVARMGIGYGVIQDKFDCLVSIDASKYLIEVEYVSGSLSDLRVSWCFEDIKEVKEVKEAEGTGGSKENNEGRCIFDLTYNTKSYFRKKMLDLLVPRLFGSFINAFKKRARKIYQKEHLS